MSNDIMSKNILEYFLHCGIIFNKFKHVIVVLWIYYNNKVLEITNI